MTLYTTLRPRPTSGHLPHVRRTRLLPCAAPAVQTPPTPLPGPLTSRALTLLPATITFAERQDAAARLRGLAFDSETRDGVRRSRSGAALAPDATPGQLRELAERLLRGEHPGALLGTVGLSCWATGVLRLILGHWA